MNRNLGTFRGDYMPGGLNQTAQRRTRARCAGKRSGEVRRQLRDLHGPKSEKKVAQLGFEQFERLYRATGEREGWAFDRRGLNSAHTYYLALMTRYRVQGNGFETTNEQSCVAMRRRGRARCRRTVQRLRKRLAAMGVLDFHHVKRSGRERRPGELDSLRVVCLHLRRDGANVTLRSWSEPALKGRRLRRETLIPPPSAADGIGRRFTAPGTDGEQAGTAPESRYLSAVEANVTPPSAERYATEEERRLAYLELCEVHAPTFLGPTQLAELASLRAGQGTARTASSDCRGLM